MKKMKEARKETVPFMEKNMPILKLGIREQQKYFQKTPDLPDFKQREISMIISKNENAEMISSELAYPGGLKPYQKK